MIFKTKNGNVSPSYLSNACNAMIESIVSLALYLSTAITVLLLLLPSQYHGSKQDVQILVLGDVGRSPRTQYHALSIAKHGGRVEIIGYNGMLFATVELLRQTMLTVDRIRPASRHHIKSPNINHSIASLSRRVADKQQDVICRSWAPQGALPGRLFMVVFGVSDQTM